MESKRKYQNKKSKADPEDIAETKLGKPRKQKDEISRNQKMEIPIKKIKPANPHKKNICLVLMGSFYPIHNDHLRCLERCKEHLETVKQYNVIGGYLLPCHTGRLATCFESAPMDQITRLKLCQLAVEDSDWIDIEPFTILQDSNLDDCVSLKNLEKHVNQMIEHDPENPIRVLQIQSEERILFT